MSITVKGGSYDFSKASVGGSWYWTVRANNTQGLGQLYEVTDVVTPYGPLVNAQIPIPGDVVLSMSESIQSVQGQLSPLLSLVQPSVTSFAVTVTEGDPDQAVGSVEFQNSGAFGSFMSVTATPDSPWLTATPSSFQGIGKNETDSVSISLATATLLNSASPYSGVVNLQDNRDPPTVVPITVTVIVLPRPAILASPSSVGLTYVITTATAGPAQTFSVQNSGPSGSLLEWSAAKVNNSAWLDFSPATGGPLASGVSESVSVSVVPASVPSVPGTYTETIRITSPNASNSPVDVTVVLTVT